MKLICKNIEADEIWGFIGKKQRNFEIGERDEGDIWTYIALDPDTKAIPCFEVGKRNFITTTNFIDNLKGQ